MKIIYIAGKIGTFDVTQVTQECKDKFNKAEKYLKSKEQCHTYNPIERAEQLYSYRPEMKTDIKKAKRILTTENLYALMSADCIYLLTDWGDSEGARVEKMLAENLGLEIIYQNDKDI